MQPVSKTFRNRKGVHPKLWAVLAASTLAFTTSAVLGLPNPYLMVDWQRHNNRLWIVLDPYSLQNGRTVLLYMTEPAYQRMSRIAMSNDMELEIIATPDDTPETVKPFAEKWSSDHPEIKSGPATVPSSVPGKTPPPVMGAKSQREPMVDGWVKFYERFISPLLKPRGKDTPKVK
jgi:hypothetical protein